MNETKQKCRLCAECNEIEDLIDLNIDKKKYKEVTSILQSIQVKIDFCSTNGLSTVICFVCYNFLILIEQFLEKVRDTQDVLNSNLEMSDDSNISYLIELSEKDDNCKNIENTSLQTNIGDIVIKKEITESKSQILENYLKGLEQIDGTKRLQNSNYLPGTNFSASSTNYSPATTTFSTVSTNLSPASIFGPASTNFSPASINFNLAGTTFSPASKNFNLAGTTFSPASKNFNLAGTTFSPASKNFNLAGTTFSPASKNFNLAGTTFSPASKNFNLAGTTFSPASKNFNLAGNNVNPAGTNFNPTGTNFYLAGTNFNLAGTNLNTAGTNFNPAGNNFNLAGTNLNPAGTNFNPAGTNFNTIPYIILGTPQYPYSNINIQDKVQNVNNATTIKQLLARKTSEIMPQAATLKSKPELKVLKPKKQTPKLNSNSYVKYYQPYKKVKIDNEETMATHQTPTTQNSTADIGNNYKRASHQTPTTQNAGKAEIAINYNTASYIRNDYDEVTTSSSDETDQEDELELTDLSKASTADARLVDHRPGLRTKIESPKPFLWTCLECSKTFEDTDMLMAHQKEQHGVRFIRKRNEPVTLEHLTCVDCKEVFPDRKKLYSHKVKMHNQHKHRVCDKCGKVCKSEKALNDHNGVYHGGQKPHACQMCNQSFLRRENLAYHVLRHMNQTRLECDHCGYRCITKTAIKNHLKVHDDAKPFKCHICHKSVKRKANLKNHMRAHTGDFFFECKPCGMRFSCWSNCNKHMKRIHNTTLKKGVVKDLEPLTEAQKSSIELEEWKKSVMKPHYGKRTKQSNKSATEPQ